MLSSGFHHLEASSLHAESHCATDIKDRSIEIYALLHSAHWMPSKMGYACQ